MADYIKVEDIKDKVVNVFALDDYLVETDQEVIDLAARNGVFDADDIATEDGHVKSHKVLRYAVVFLCMRVCQDKTGVNNTDLPVEIEKYAVKFKMYKDELKMLDGQITKEMITGTVDQVADRAQSFRLFRA